MTQKVAQFPETNSPRCSHALYFWICRPRGWASLAAHPRPRIVRQSPTLAVSTRSHFQEAGQTGIPSLTSLQQDPFQYSSRPQACVCICIPSFPGGRPDSYTNPHFNVVARPHARPPHVHTVACLSQDLKFPRPRHPLTRATSDAATMQPFDIR
jgi:hypothetical protein